MLERLDFCTTFVAILILNLVKLVLHHLLAKLWVVEDRLQVSYLTLKFLVLGMQLIHTQTSKLSQAHVYNSLRLDFVELESFLQVALCVAWCLRGTDNMNHLVDIVACNDESFKDMCTFLCLLKVELGTTYCNVMTMLYKVLNTFLKSKQAWTAIDQCNAVDRERRLHGCHLVELVKDNIGVGIALYIYNNAHTLTSRLVVYIRYAGNLAFLNKVGNASNKVGLVYTIRYLGYYNLVVRIAALDFALGTHHNASATSLISLFNSSQTIYICTGREIRSLDVLHKFIGIDVWIVDIGTASVYYLTKVVCRNVGSHTYGNTITAINQ